LKEMKRRRGKGKAIKIDISFTGNPNIRFIIDLDDSHSFNNAVEKIDFVLELLQYHLDPEKLPQNVTEVIYNFDIETARWKLNTAQSDGKKFVLGKNGWEILT